MRRRRPGAQQRVDRQPKSCRNGLAALTAVASLALLAPAGAGAVKKPSPYPLKKPTWLTQVTITEYFATLEKWFVGRRVSAPGLTSAHRVDWLYSASGVTMEGDGIGLDGLNYHVEAVGSGGWVDKFGRPTALGSPIFWRAGGYWLNAQRRLTYPLEVGGWSNGFGKKYVPLSNVRFGPGMSLPLKPWRSIAVDPRIISLGSRVYVPSYKATAGGGWFLAQDTGGAINGRHIDVYRPAPSTPDGASSSIGERIYVIPPGARAPKSAPKQTSSTATSPSGGTTAG
jgi:3D (Asp-Asp-Asp) domain-containing protein